MNTPSNLISIITGTYPVLGTNFILTKYKKSRTETEKKSNKNRTKKKSRLKGKREEGRKLKMIKVILMRILLKTKQM